MGIYTRKNGIMWKVGPKQLPKLLGSFDFFVGNRKNILPWVAFYEKNQLGTSLVSIFSDKKHPWPPTQFKFRILSITKHVIGDGPDAVGPRVFVLVECPWLI